MWSNTGYSYTSLLTLSIWVYEYMSNNLSMPGSYNPGHEKLDIKYIL